MKRLATCHRKTPVRKEDQCPDFYDLAKTSPLPEIVYQRGGSQVIPSAASLAQPGIVSSAGQMSQYSPMSFGVPTTMGSHLGGPMVGNINEQVLSMLANDAAARSMNVGMMPPSMGGSVGQPPRVAQLQRDNEDLRRRLLEMESMQAAHPGGGVVGFGNQGHQPLSLVSEQRAAAAISSNISSASNPNGGGGNNLVLERELERMQRDFMMRSNTNNTPMNNSLLSSFGGNGNVSGGGGGDGSSNYSFMAGYPRDEMLLRAMRLENQMGYPHQFPQGPSSSSTSSTTTSSLERALQQQQQQQQQQHQNNNSPNTSSVLPTGEDGTKAVMDWVAKQQKQQHTL